jgi:hypothetical protein
MIIYNVTVIIDETVHEEWLGWMKEIHIPEVMATGCFTEYRFCKILAETEGGISYSIQYSVESRAILDKYSEEFAPALQQAHNAKYAGKFGAFRTLLEEV